MIQGILNDVLWIQRAADPIEQQQVIKVLERTVFVFALVNITFINTSPFSKYSKTQLDGPLKGHFIYY